MTHPVSLCSTPLPASLQGGADVLHLFDIFLPHNKVDRILKRFYPVILSDYWIPTLSGLSCLKTFFIRSD